MSRLQSPRAVLSLPTFYDNKSYIKSNYNVNATKSYYQFPKQHQQEPQSLQTQPQREQEPNELASLLIIKPIDLYYNSNQSTHRRVSGPGAVALDDCGTVTRPVKLQKSNSYSGTTLPAKPTKGFIAESEGNLLNEKIYDDDSVAAATATAAAAAATSELSAGTATFNNLTDDNDNDTTSSSYQMPNDDDAQEEYDAFLISNNNDTQNSAINSQSTNSSSSNTNSTRRNSKRRNKLCLRAHAILTYNKYIGYLVPLSILMALMVVAYLTRDYAKQLLYWIEVQNPWITFVIFLALFVIVSFPIVVGYFVLKITVGYLFGFVRGFPTVILGANLGIAIAHIIIQNLRLYIPMHKIIKNETSRAILRVIAGPRAFKVVLFTRLTPIPFGLQNAIFGVSSINPRIYHLATFIGLLPAQAINVYLGSTLRSMHEVLNSNGHATITGYITFGVEVICGIALMFWVVQKARKELSETLLSDISEDRKYMDVQV